MRFIVGHSTTRPLLGPSFSAFRHSAPRADLLEDIKYGLSNADEGSRPARDLIENPVAAACACPH